MERNYEHDQQVRACRACPLGEMRVARGGIAVPADPGVNYTPGGIALMGQGPGANEDALGLPFVGAAGHVLDGLLEEVSLSRDSLLLLNRVRCRPPDNSLADYPDAIGLCDPWLQAELRHYSPSVVVAMGADAYGLLFGSKPLVRLTRGHPRDDGERIWVPTYHPAAILYNRNEEIRDYLLDDLRLAKVLHRQMGGVRD